MKGSMRVILLPVETAGFLSGLEKGLLELGVDARAVTIENHPSQYSRFTRNPEWASQIADLTNLKNRGGKPLAPLIYTLALALRLWGSVWVAVRATHIILNNGRSLLPWQLDVLLYRSLGIQVIAMMGHGSEIRPACIDSLGENQRFAKGEIRRIYRQCRNRKRFARRVERWSHLVISTPTISHYLRMPYINSHLIGIPVSLPSGIKPPREFSAQPLARSVKVVHVPSAPGAKGTEVIMSLCLDLEAEGLIKFKAISGVTHSEAIQMLSESDLLLDQVYSDVYMPVLATEAAFLGKPSIVAGYSWDYLDCTSSRLSKPPVINVLPQEIEETLRSLVAKPSEIQEIGRLAKKFVETHRTPSVIGEKYLRLLSGDEDFLAEILVKPGPPHYIWGCGSSMSAIRSLAFGSRSQHTCF
jgi:hypothetical protein